MKIVPVAQFGQRVGVDELDIADPVGQHCRAAGRIAQRFGGQGMIGQGMAAQKGPVQPRSDRPGGGLFQPVDGVAHAAQLGQLVNPAQQGQHDQDDDHHRDHEQQRPALRAIDADPQRDQPHDAEQERPDEGRQHRLDEFILGQQGGGARRRIRGGRSIGRGQRRDRKGRDRQHGRGDHVQQAVDRLGTDVDGQRPGQERGQACRNRRRHAQQRIERHADPQRPAQARQNPAQARHGYRPRRGRAGRWRRAFPRDLVLGSGPITQRGACCPRLMGIPLRRVQA